MMSEPTLNEQAKEWLKVSGHPKWCKELMAANEQCDCGLQLVIDLEAKLSKMEEQDEIHWRTRRKLLKDREALEQRVEGLEEKLLSVLEVAVARGEKLGYEDAAYRKDLEEALEQT